MNTLGLVPERHKVVITGLAFEQKANGVLKTMLEKYRFDNPNAGIAFTVPVDRVSY
ncbi:MAG: hypothetical protein FWE82_09265 [Defluviitaleaceae bacterium]|nr:hypothetical protein [Defluviitaleaceae bacterium]